MAIVELDQDVRRTLAGHLSGVAWPTVVISLVCMAAFFAVALLGLYGPLPLWLGYLLNTSILYVIFTPLHEAAHGNIAGRDKQWIWLNNLIGHGAGVLMLYEFNIYKHMHMQHHRNTNDPEYDPEGWVKADSLPWAVLKSAIIYYFFIYYFIRTVVFRPNEPGNIALAARTLAIYALLYAFIGGLIYQGFVVQLLALWIGPHLTAAALLIFFYSYVIHSDAQEDFLDTEVILFRGRFASILEKLYMYQTLHIVHHLAPRIPFFRYGQAFDDIRPKLEDAGTRIRNVTVG